jgi:hypothetical protein
MIYSYPLITAIIIIILLLIIIVYLRLFININSKLYNVHSHPITKNYIINNSACNNEKKTNNVIVYMSLDYQIIPKYGELSIKLAQEYCELHKYKFKVFDHSKTDNRISPYWIRINDMKNILESEPENTIVVYLDLDAVVNPKFFNIGITDFIDTLDIKTKKTWNIYAATDPALYNYEMNTGILIMRNTPWTRKFVSLWFDNYPKDFWKKQNDKWNCKDCVWAGDEYEQGMLNRLYTRNVLDSKEYILPIDYSILGNTEINETSFMLHFMGKSDTNREELFTKLIKETKTLY